MFFTQIGHYVITIGVLHGQITIFWILNGLRRYHFPYG
ncbi:hypothetical protein FHW03_001180 [Ochrobactrum sp. RH2CCR150]|nr:hypothetical protein [Ochrobactrum sp. RH2CCR150]